MKTLIFILIMVSFNQGFASTDCEAKLVAARQLMNEEDFTVLVDEIIEEEVLPMQPQMADSEAEIEELLSFVLPNGYAETQSEYEAARKKAVELAAIAKNIQLEMDEWNPNISFTERFDLLAQRYEAAEDKKEKTAILSRMISIFEIRHENEYMEIIRGKKYSKELRKVLYKALFKLFLTDPSWILPLEEAKRAGGL